MKSFHSRRMLSIVFLAFILMPLPACSQLPDYSSVTISKSEIERHIDYLCQAKCEGRGPRTTGVDTAAQYIADEFKKYSLKTVVAYPDYFQSFDRLNFNYKNQHEQKVSFTTPNGKLELENPFIHASVRSSSGQVSGDVVFAGYGISTQDYSDYTNLDVTGKIVLILRNEPRFITEKYSTQFFGKGSIHATLSQKAHVAHDKGAIAVVFIADPENQKQLLKAREKDLYYASHYDTPYATEENDLGLPVLMLDPEKIETLISSEKLQGIQHMIEETKTPQSFHLLSVTATVVIDLRVEKYKAKNVIAILPGNDPDLRKEAVIIGAHYDQDGLKHGKPLPGADDNASGTAGVLAIAKAIKDMDHNNKRTYIFVAYGAEEPQGGTASTTGSDYLLSTISQLGFIPYAGINMDMIGRADLVRPSIFSWARNLFKGKQTNKIYYSHLPGCEAIDSICQLCNEEIELSLNGHNPYNNSTTQLLGDHQRFFYRGIPYVHFYDANHADLHTPRDKPRKINLKKAQKVSQLAMVIATNLANSTEKLQVNHYQWLEAYSDLISGDYRY